MSTEGPARQLDLSTVSVAEVVVRLPKTLAPTATVAQARAALADDHVHMLLITDRGRLLGTLLRADLPDTLGADAAALDHAVLEGRTVAPDVSAEQARQVLLRRGQRRLAVVGPNGQLLGLLCLKRRLTGFCSDADVRSRAGDGVRRPRG